MKEQTLNYLTKTEKYKIVFIFQYCKPKRLRIFDDSVFGPENSSRSYLPITGIWSQDQVLQDRNYFKLSFHKIKSI
jgi:hypothetical protein